MTSPLSDAQKGTRCLNFQSILFDESEIGTKTDPQEAPQFMADLNLDQIIDSMTDGRDEYDLKPLFRTPLQHVEAIEYRHQALRDLENRGLFEHVQSFAKEMRTMRSHLAQAEKLYYKYQQQSWFLDAVNIYCHAVQHLFSDLTASDLASCAFRSLREYLNNYIHSYDFALLISETDKLHADLSEIRYTLHLEGKRIKVSRYNSEPDYGVDVLHTFEKFKQGTGKRYRFDPRFNPQMDHIEAGILDLVAQLYPDTFASLEQYCARYRDFLDTKIRVFDREVQFYIACLEYIDRLRGIGLPFCYPRVTERSKEVYGRDVFDLALANRLADKKTPVVKNDFHLRDPERIIVVSGPNQGGKTTFARTFGQLHYLASIGSLVPGTEAKLFLYDKLFTHFEKEESIRNLSGKLEEDLLRIHLIFQSATPNSILIMNESFVSTTLNDALFLSKRIMERIIECDMLCVTVTFLDELSTFSNTTVSMVSTVDPSDPALRTFKIIRKPADGLAYAVAIADKYRLTYTDLKARIAEKGKERV